MNIRYFQFIFVLGYLGYEINNYLKKDTSLRGTQFYFIVL
jgi:hypothetical protein